MVAYPLIRQSSSERRPRLDHAVERSADRGKALRIKDAVEAADAYTGFHTRGVLELSLGVAEHLALDPWSRHLTELTALLHDVGKIRIPNEIINKSGELTSDERALIETHTIEGERLLDQVGGRLAEVGRLVRSCHERYDGGGYPDGLAGEEIPIVARIVCCCDAFDAMTTTRSYRSAMSYGDARTELRLHRATQFDPRVVDALLALTA